MIPSPEDIPTWAAIVAGILLAIAMGMGVWIVDATIGKALGDEEGGIWRRGR